MDIALVDPPAFDRLIGEFFGVDRFGKPKGMVEVQL